MEMHINYLINKVKKHFTFFDLVNTTSLWKRW